MKRCATGTVTQHQDDVPVILYREQCPFGSRVPLGKLKKQKKNLLIQIICLQCGANLSDVFGPLQTDSHIRLDLRRRVDEERLEGADLGIVVKLFPLYVRAKPPQPPDVYHQPSCFLSL